MHSLCIWLDLKKWWVAVPPTCSFLICSGVGKTSGYEGRSKTRSNASSCCWVKASALRCFRKLSTLPWESLCGPEPSEPSTRRKKQQSRHWPREAGLYFKLCTWYSPHVFLYHLCGGSEEDEKDGVYFFCTLMAVVSHWLHHTGCFLHPTPHSINTIMIWMPSGNWWITITCNYIHVVASICTNEMQLPVHYVAI